MPDSNSSSSRLRACAVIAIAGVVSGCAIVEATRSLPPAAVGESIARGEVARDQAAVTPPVEEAGPDSGTQPEPASSSADLYRPGSGVFVRQIPAADGSQGPGEITLNFENTNLLEVVKVILADLMKQNYVIDPGVQGAVTLQTSQPLPRDGLIPTLEMLLRMNGAALVKRGDMYHVVPRESAMRGLTSPQLGNSTAPLPRGYSVRVAPLRYVSASEMQKILEPFVTAGNIVRVDTQRNLLILAGTGQELETLLETIAVFDVDWVAGMSMALFTPDFVDAKTLAADLEKVFGDPSSGPLAGLVKLAVIERLNALLVISPRREYLGKVSEWVDRLDQDRGGSGRRLFIYHVQNGKAADLAAVLQQVFEDRAAERAVPPPELAPGLEAAEIRTPAPPPAQATEEAATGAAPRPEAPERRPPPRASNRTGDGLQLSEGGQIRIIADEVNNALLVMATAAEYAQVREALKQLDIVPLQVLIEATIAEVSLTDNLQYGLEWFFKNEIGSRVGQGQLDLDASISNIAPAVPGFSYAVTSAGAVRAVLNTLASDSKLKVISSPSLMVLNNQTATIQVGDQVPITTQQQQSTTGVSNIVNSVEFRDTGVLLTVTPRVNAGGLVTLEISQEVSDVRPNPSDPLTPTIQQRKINSTVAIQSGETVVLGGLIRENDNVTASGFPGLYKIPLLGFLFGRSTDNRERTELVVLITPRAVQGAEEAHEITEEFRAKMESLKPENADKKNDGEDETSPGTTQ